MQNQNPENYAIKKGIPSNRIEKHIQGTLLIALVILGSYVYFYRLNSFIFFQRFVFRKSTSYHNIKWFGLMKMVSS